MKNLKALEAANKFHQLAKTASRSGGMWISAAGGTANVIAGVIARAVGVSFEEAYHALDASGGANWYADLAYQQPWAVDYLPEHPRWDADLIARAACRAVA